MTDIEQKALALIKPGASCEVNFENISILATAFTRAIEQHEATKQELSDYKQKVSDAVGLSIERCGHDGLRAGHINEYLGRFIIPAPKPDPLVEIFEAWFGNVQMEPFRAALDARGLEIRSKNDDR